MTSKASKWRLNMGYSPNIFHHLVNSPKNNSPNDKFTNSTIEQLVNSTIFYSTGANSTRVSSPIQTVCLKAPPGGLRSGALAPRSQGVWGLAPILGLPRFMAIKATLNNTSIEQNVNWTYYQLQIENFGESYIVQLTDVECWIGCCSVHFLFN